jgi:hypothetical protein
VSYLGPSREHTLADHLNRESLDDVPAGRPTQGGIFGFTLCKKCNEWTGHEYGREYKQWVDAAWGLIQALAPKLGIEEDRPNVAYEVAVALDAIDGFASFEAEFHDIDLGAFARQVLTMMASIAGDWGLTHRHPEIRQIVLDKLAMPLPSQLSLSMHLYLGPNVRVIGPSLLMNRESGHWRWVCEVAYPPFAHDLVLASNITDDQRLPGSDTGDLTARGPGHRASVKGPMYVGFGHTPYPGDLRTRAQCDADFERVQSAES